MNLLLLEEHERRSDRCFTVAGQKARHLIEILRVAPGRRVRAGLLEGPLGEAVVRSVGREVELEVELSAAPPPRPKTDLILAVARPKTMAKVIPQIAAFGVDRLVLLRTWKVEKPYLTAAVLAPDRIRELLIEGLMLGRSTRLPQVTLEPLFRPFVEDRLPAILQGASLKLVAHPASGRTMRPQPLDEEERAVVAIGPEGGLIPYEVEALERAGMERVEIAAHLLRVETAAVAALAQIELLRGFGRDKKRRQDPTEL
jgi:RsmE family RNA methyltransferase